MTTPIHETEVVEISQLRAHPRNYRAHPADQVEQIKSSLVQNGFYRNVVVASDWTILAGHGVVEASKQLGLDSVPVVRLDVAYDSVAALKVLAGDNYLGHFSEDDDRMLTDLLKEIADEDDLTGTGFDAMMLANLVMVTRPASELADFDAAAEWAGLPSYEVKPLPPQLVISFASEEERDQAIADLKIHITQKHGRTWSTEWGKTEATDLSSIKFQISESEESGDEE